MSGENPTNQASNQSLDVPVLPAIGLPTAATLMPVPCCTTPSIIETICWSAIGSMSGSGLVGLWKIAAGA